MLGTCKNILPFEVNSEKAADAREDLRLEYRFLDLRNEKLHKTIILRSEIMKTIRNKMDELGFTEIQTPILANLRQKVQEISWYQADYTQESSMLYLKHHNNLNNC